MIPVRTTEPSRRRRFRGLTGPAVALVIVGSLGTYLASQVEKARNAARSSATT